MGGDWFSRVVVGMVDLVVGMVESMVMADSGMLMELVLVQLIV